MKRSCRDILNAHGALAGQNGPTALEEMATIVLAEGVGPLAKPDYTNEDVLAALKAREPGLVDAVLPSPLATVSASEL